MKLHKTLQILIPLGVALINPAILHATEIEADISGTCQLQSSDTTATYYLKFAASTQHGSLTYTINSIDSTGVTTVVAQGPNYGIFNYPTQVTMQLSADAEPKTLKIVGTQGFLSRANRFIVTQQVVIELTQIIHPDDGSRAAGAIFHGVHALSGKNVTLLPEGVKLQGPGNCFHLVGINGSGL